MGDNVLPHIEWEFLSDSETFSTTEAPNDWPTGTRAVHVSRDDLYRLEIQIEGSVHKLEHAYRDEETGQTFSPMSPLGRPGAWTDRFDAVAYRYGEACTFRGCRCLGWQTTTSEENPQLDEFVVDLEAESIAWSSTMPDELSWVTNWYLNGACTPLFFTRFTRRGLEQRYSRQRPGRPELGLESRVPPMPASDALLVEAGSVKYAVGCVPKGLGPKWAHPVGIEFYADWGIPSLDDRKAVAEIVGFVMGRRLLPVGSSGFNEHGNLREWTVTSPRDLNITRTCQRADFLPVATAGWDRDPNSEKPSEQEATLRDLTSPYLERREKYGLSDALNRYYLSFQMPLQAALPTIAAAVETLAERWRVSQGESPDVAYLPVDRYKELIQAEIESIGQKLSDVPYKERIISRIASAWHPGTNQKVPWFLEKVGLAPTRFEKQILAARHAPAHGAEPGDVAEAHRQLIGYQTMFNRAFLRLLGHEGTYIDWSLERPRSRPMSEPVGS